MYNDPRVNDSRLPVRSSNASWLCATLSAPVRARVHRFVLAFVVTAGGLSLSVESATADKQGPTFQILVGKSDNPKSGKEPLTCIACCCENPKDVNKGGPNVVLSGKVHFGDFSGATLKVLNANLPSQKSSCQAKSITVQGLLELANKKTASFTGSLIPMPSGYEGYLYPRGANANVPKNTAVRIEGLQIREKC